MYRVSFISILLFLLSFTRLNAAGGLGMPCYGGGISYSIDSANPLKINVTVTLFFLNDGPLSSDSIVLNWDDSTSTAIYATGIAPDSLAFANTPVTPPIYAHSYSGGHTYSSVPDSGYYFISISNLYRAAGAVNIAANGSGPDALFTLQAQVGADTSLGFIYTAPTLLPVDIFVCTADTFYANQLVTAPNGDSVTFQLITPLYAPGYQLPGQSCRGISDSSFVINSSTGVITWPDVCHDSTYDFATLISTYRHGNLIGSIMRDQLLYILEGTAAITETTVPVGIGVYPNPANSQLYVTLPLNTTGGQIILYDIAGKEVLANKISNSIQQTMDISTLPQGAYLLTYKSSDGLFTQKVVKQ